MTPDRYARFIDPRPLAAAQKVNPDTNEQQSQPERAKQPQLGTPKDPLLVKDWKPSR